VSQMDAIKHFKDAVKSYEANNANFIFSLFAGYELLFRHFQSTDMNNKLFYRISQAYFIADVSTRITERHDINMLFVKKINNMSKHKKYQDSLLDDFNLNRNKIWHRYFVEMNKLFKILKTDYNYQVDFTFQQPNSKPKLTHPIDSKLQNKIKKNNGPSPFKDFISTEVKSESGGGEDDSEYLNEMPSKVGEVLLKSNNKVKNRIHFNNRYTGFTIFDKARGKKTVFLDQRCTVQLLSLKDNKGMLSKTTVYAIYDRKNRLIFWGSENAKEMYKHLYEIFDVWLNQTYQM